MHSPDPERMSLNHLYMTGMPDVERLTRKLQRRKCSLADLCGLYRASSKLPGIVAALQNHAGEHAELLLSRCAGGHGACADAHI
jgi:DNA mismatch repair protein MSH2